MAETLTFNFVGNDEISAILQRMDRVVAKLDRNLDQLGRSARGVGLDMSAAERQVDGLGDEMTQAALRADHLKDELAGVNREVALTKVLARDIDRDGRLFGGLFSGKVGSPLTLGLIGAAVAAAPLIAAALSGAVLGALGGAAVAGGIAGAFADERVRDAAKGLAGTLKADLIDATTVFVEPTLDGIRRIADQWQAVLLPQIRGTLSAAAGFTDEVVEAGIGFVREVLPGIRSAVEQAGPVFDVLRSDLPMLGRAIGDMFERMGDNADDAAQGLHDLLRLTEASVAGLGLLLAGLTNVYALTRSPLILALDFAESDVHKAGRIKDAAGEVGDAFKNMQSAADRAKEEVRGLNKAFDDLFDKTMNVDEATIAFNLGMIELAETIRENGRTLDINTEAGLRTRDALLQQIEAAKGARDAAIAIGDGTQTATDKANAAYLTQIDQIHALGKSMGLPIGQLDAIIARYRAIIALPNPVKMITFLVAPSQAAATALSRTTGRAVAFSHGGPVNGSGPRGVDSVPLLAAPGEYVLTEDMVGKLGGVPLLERLRTGGGGTPAGSGAAPRRWFRCRR